MPDNEQQIYTLPNDGDGWATGDVITADKMNAIGNVLHNTSEEVANAVNDNIDSNGPNNDILARKLDGMVKNIIFVKSVLNLKKAV